MLTRRRFLAIAGAAACADALKPAQLQADFTLRIAEISLDLGFGHSVRTVAYNGQVPGPILRMTEGRMTTVDVVNETGTPEMVHWHGFHVPPEVDGAHEEGTPMVQGFDRRTFSFIAQPAGTRWYHTHAMAGHNLKTASYSGQFGLAIVEPRQNAAAYDLEVPVILHEWEGSFAADNDMDVRYARYSINGKILGAGEPIRVRRSQRILLRILNSSATMQHRLALPGHTFQVLALDGNALLSPVRVPAVQVAPGERVDAVVEMTNPGVWILGETDDEQRRAGAGIVFEYANQRGAPQWTNPQQFQWGYALFGERKASPEPATRIPIVIEPGVDGNLWAINGKSWPNTDQFLLRPGVRNRLMFDNRSSMDHPVHLHRHTFEFVSYAGAPLIGIRKDVIMLPARSKAEVDVMAEQPGPALFHCHQQFHMDFGFMALMHCPA